MYTAAAVLYPNALATSITLPMEILQAASQMACTGSRGAPQVRFLLAGPDRKMITLGTGISLTPDATFDDLPPLDLLLLPAIWRNPLPTINGARSWLDLLPKLAASGTLICSVGTGSCLLAEAGLLSGKPATTHWNYFKQFSRRYPEVELKTRHLITQSDNIYCVGSVNSIADLMVHIVQEWFGSRIARAVENQFSPEIRQTFNAAAYQNEAGSSHHDEAVLEAQQWLQEHLPAPISMTNLAAHLKLSPRTLNRRFKQAMGMSPQAYLQSLRIAAAKDLLRNSNLNIGDIAWQLGLHDVSYFSQLFRRHSGISPLRYREAVRGKLFEPGILERP
ncbi:MAG: AraC family transcriptional regulator [Gammaproteobacteria bacterium]|nr:MAG: AraC family transcriptional regulator [Gammaproteobacteria bacterium]RLA60093.1 MAG: AraC family transcriptional regulator [Gammaproteobacteria bacterium]